jgi:hypothetical protein
MGRSGEPGSAKSRAPDLIALGVVTALALWVFAPFFRDTRAMGFQDWDVQAAYRYVTVLAVREHGQWPWWNPWFCGGFPAWGYAESATNLVSPFAPLYFLFSFPLALRLEAVAGTIAAVLTSYLLAGRFTRVAAMRAFVAAGFVLSSRWALQISSGHMWHLAYAWMPLALYFFDRAVRDGETRLAVAAGATMALMIYVGGIYPLPHTALLLGVFTICAAIQRRAASPLGLLLLAGAVAFGLSAPKLLPVLVTVGHFPRVIPSNEPIGLADLWVMLTGHTQSFGEHPILEIAFFWVWWEWGIYVGVAGVAALIAGVATGATGAARRELLWLRVAGLACFLLALGGTAWHLVHALPFFRSQHIPSRLLFPGVLCLFLALAGAVDAPWRRFAAARRWAEPALLALVTVYAIDLAIVARQATEAPFRLRVPAVERAPEFAQLQRQPWSYGKPDIARRSLRERYDWPAKITYPTMLANRGMVRCYGVPPEVHSNVVGSDQPGYRGLAHLAGGPGVARVVDWTPNAVRVEVSGARPGDTLVYDMNFDDGWRADGKAALDTGGLVGARVESANATVDFRYRPPRLGAGLALCAVTLLGIASAAFVRRRRARTTS